MALKIFLNNLQINCNLATQAKSKHHEMNEKIVTRNGLLIAEKFY